MGTPPPEQEGDGVNSSFSEATDEYNLVEDVDDLLEGFEDEEMKYD